MFENFLMLQFLVLRYRPLKISVQCYVAIYFMIGDVFTHKALWLILTLYTTNHHIFLIYNTFKKRKIQQTHQSVLSRGDSFNTFLSYYQQNASILRCLQIIRSLERDFEREITRNNATRYNNCVY